MDDDNKTLWRVAELIRLVFDMFDVAAEESIVIGRENILHRDYSKQMFVVDSLPSSNVIAAGEKFDGVAEQMKFITLWRHDITIDVYGKSAWSDATRLGALMRSQKATDVKTALGLSGFIVSSKTDLKELTGSQYINRVQLGCIVHDNEAVDVETLRIDTVQLNIINEQGTIHDSQSE